MANKPDIQYMYYVPGSEARVIEFKPAQKQRRARTVLPQEAPQKKTPLIFDRAAVCGLAVAAVMLVLIAVGLVQYRQVCNENTIMSDRIIQLQNEYVQLREEYEAGYDLEEIRTMADAMGLVSADQLRTITMRVEVPTPEAEPTWWDNMCWFVEGLFA